jgi:hypothetical protein
VSLIDCGQFKSLSRSRRLQFAELVLAVDQYQQAVESVGESTTSTTTAAIQQTKKELAHCARGFGIKCIDGRESDDDLACAIALVLFSDTGVTLPGNYSSNELSPDSPIRLLTSFPQELVLLGRATVLLKGIAKRLEVRLSLVEQWSDDCQRTLESSGTPTMPLWGASREIEGNAFIVPTRDGGDSPIRLRQVGRLLNQWAKGKTKRLGKRLMKRMPTKLRMSILEYVLARQERRQLAKRAAMK